MANAAMEAIVIRKFSSNTCPCAMFRTAFSSTLNPGTRYTARKISSSAHQGSVSRWVTAIATANNTAPMMILIRILRCCFVIQTASCCSCHANRFILR